MKFLIKFLIITFFLTTNAFAKNECEISFSEDLDEPENVQWSEDWYFEDIFEETSEIIIPSYLNFTEATPVDGGRQHSQPVVTAIADFNNDGFDDFMITYHETRRHSSIIFSDGKGGLELIDLPTASTSRLLREVSVSDFNGDGLLDIYGHTAPHDWTEKEGVKNKNYGMDEPDFLLVNIDGQNFKSIDISALMNSNNHQGAVADFDQDGFVDVFSQPQKSKSSRFVLYNKNGTAFERGGKEFSKKFARLQYWDAEAADLNGDEYPDLLLTIQHFKSDPNYLKKRGSIALILNNAGSIEEGEISRFGDFWTTEEEWENILSYLSCLSENGMGELHGTTAASAEIKLYDFNGDGNLDIFVTQLASGHFDRGAIEFGTFLRYFENDGKGNFKDLTSNVFPHQELNKIFVKPVGRSIAIHFSDISGDGIEDLILQNIGSRYTELEWEQYPYIYIRDNNKFLPTNKENVEDLYWKNQIFPADLDGNGKLDLVAMRYDKRKYKRYKFITYLNDVQSSKYAHMSASPDKNKYDRSDIGLRQRFQCLAEYGKQNGLADLPSDAEIDNLITNIQGIYYYRSHSQIIKLGISEKSMASNKHALVRLVNYEGTNIEFCKKPVL